MSGRGRINIGWVEFVNLPHLCVFVHQPGLQLLNEDCLVQAPDVSQQHRAPRASQHS